MDDIFSGLGGNLSGNDIAFGSMANTPNIGSTYTPDPKVLAQYESHPKADLNTPWYSKAWDSTSDFFSGIGDFFSGGTTKLILILILIIILYALITRRSNA